MKSTDKIWAGMHLPSKYSFTIKYSVFVLMHLEFLPTNYLHSSMEIQIMEEPKVSQKAS